MSTFLYSLSSENEKKWKKTNFSRKTNSESEASITESKVQLWVCGMSIINQKQQQQNT